MTGSGTLNLSALTNAGPSGGVTSGMEPSSGSVDVGSATTVTDDQYTTTFTGSTIFGTGGSIPASSGTGQTFGFFRGDLQVPSGYTSGSSLAGTAVLNGQTFASLHVTPGTYTITWGTGANADFFTVQVGPPASVPEPSTYALLGVFSVVGTASALIRRRRTLRA